MTDIQAKPSLRWVKASKENLPELGQNVLVKFDYGDRVEYEVFEWDKGDSRFWKENGIAAWMPAEALSAILESEEDCLAHAHNMYVTHLGVCHKCGGTMLASADNRYVKLETEPEKREEVFLAAFKHYDKVIENKLGWRGHFHLFLASLFPNMFFSQRERIINAAERVLEQVGPDARLTYKQAGDSSKGGDLEVSDRSPDESPVASHTSTFNNSNQQ